MTINLARFALVFCAANLLFICTSKSGISVKEIKLLLLMATVSLGTLGVTFVKDMDQKAILIIAFGMLAFSAGMTLYFNAAEWFPNPGGGWSLDLPFFYKKIPWQRRRRHGVYLALGGGSLERLGPNWEPNVPQAKQSNEVHYGHRHSDYLNLNPLPAPTS